MNDALARLAEHCGIAAAYHDIWGHLHPASTYTRQALLAAMHLPPSRIADDPQGLLDELIAQERRRLLPPVCVVRVGTCPRIPLGELGQAGNWRWMLHLEDGTTLSGEFIPAASLELPPLEALGYHRLELNDGAASHAMPLIGVPERCHQPEKLARGGRSWGLAVQLYSLRSSRNWGIGDFGDLLRLIDLVAEAGGDAIGVNPLHALFSDQPTHISPYSPSHRGFVNVLYLDIEAIPEFAACEAAQRRRASAEFQARLAALRAAPQVDYPGVAATKFEILALLFQQFQRAGGARAAEFATWRAEQGDALERFARYCALQEHFRKTQAAWGWPAWPEAYRDPTSEAVAAFAREHAEAIAYHAWLQWLADEQMRAIAARAEQLGMAIGLYEDLAIGANPGGAELWADQGVFAQGAHAGAPPDEINLMGQDWGLPPFDPHALREAAYAPFIAILRANMRHAGALRIDHVMGLKRIFWVPANLPASEGAYVHYPFEDLLGLVALESQRNRCLVIGEDLGTVPEGFRERLAAAGILSYHPLVFERYADGHFRLPSDMPQQALVAVGTHDLPTLAAFWRGDDLRLRAALGLFPNEAMQECLTTEREWDRGRLLWALERVGLLPSNVSKDPAQVPEMTDELMLAIHAYLAQSPAQLFIIQPEDLFGVIEQTNVPGTLEHQHPNWQRKLPVPIEAWPADGRFARLAALLREARPN
ncbi:MAG: 4-alpha-glucanotransferase [Rhodocyclaceae bacterium]|nr:4-alpha-glucanotransferase [Rhodocyclaceae bacterium]